MNLINFEDLMKEDCYKQILLNDRFKWSFLDSYTFSNFLKDENSPSNSCYSDGNVIENDKLMIGKIIITKHLDTNKISGVLYLKKFNDEKWETMVNIVSMKEI